MAENVNENEATVLQFADAENISSSDILYLIQGTGADRDRQMTLEQLREFLQGVFTALTVIGTGGNATIKNGSLNLNSSIGSAKITIENGVEIQYGSKKLFFNHDSFGFEGESGEANGQVSFDSDNRNWVFNINCQFDEGVDIYGTANVTGNVVASGNLKGATAEIESAAITKMTGNTSFDTLVNGTRVNATNIEGNNVTGNVVKSNSYVDAKYTCSKIFEATDKSTLLDPESILAGCASLGAMVLVKNATGSNVVISRQADGSNYEYFVIASGEFLLYIYNGTKWVHAW